MKILTVRFFLSTLDLTLSYSCRQRSRGKGRAVTQYPCLTPRGRQGERRGPLNNDQGTKTRERGGSRLSGLNPISMSKGLRGIEAISGPE